MQAFMQQKRKEMELKRLEQTKEQLGVTDQEWAIIKPRLLAVQKRKDASEGRLDQMAMSSLRSRNRNSNTPTGNEVYDSRTQLQRLLADDKTSAQVIKEQLTALRKAEERAKQKLAKARQGLRSLLTLRQEAYLVTTQVLD